MLCHCRTQTVYMTQRTMVPNSKSDFELRASGKIGPMEPISRLTRSQGLKTWFQFFAHACGGNSVLSGESLCDSALFHSKDSCEDATVPQTLRSPSHPVPVPQTLRSSSHTVPGMQIISVQVAGKLRPLTTLHTTGQRFHQMDVPSFGEGGSVGKASQKPEFRSRRSLSAQPESHCSACR